MQLDRNDTFNKENIPHWRVFSDRVMCPLIGIISTFLFLNKIIATTPKLLYTMVFFGEACLMLLFAFFSTSDKIKSSMFSLAVYYLCTAGFAAIITRLS